MKKLLTIAAVLIISGNAYALAPTEGRGYLDPDVPDKDVALNNQPSVGSVMHEHTFMHEHQPAALDSKYWEDINRNHNKNR